VIKIIKDLLKLALFAGAGYVLYKVWRAASAATTAAGSVATTAGSFSLPNIAQAVKADAGAAWDAITGTIAGGASVAAQSVQRLATGADATPNGIPAVADNLTGNVASGLASDVGSWWGTPSADNTVKFTGPSMTYQATGLSPTDFNNLMGQVVSAGTFGAATY